MEAETSPSAGIRANLISGSSLHSHFQNFSFLFFFFCGFSLSTASTSHHLLLLQQRGGPSSFKTETWQDERAKNFKQFYTASDTPQFTSGQSFRAPFNLHNADTLQSLSKSALKVLKVNFQPSFTYSTFDIMPLISCLILFL